MSAEAAPRPAPRHAAAPDYQRIANTVVRLVDAADRVRADAATGECAGLLILLASAGELLAAAGRTTPADLLEVADRLWWVAL